jgi:serine/threonine-protein kinase
LNHSNSKYHQQGEDMKEEIISFPKKEYIKIEEIDRGALGRTVLLRDDIIGQFYVCKKYQPIEGIDPCLYYNNFVNEIKVMHLLNNKNVVRFFSYYLYPSLNTGFIIMEYIKGKDISLFIKENPDKINDIFAQCIEGFSYLESEGILHRDIRLQNILVSESEEVKIIDFGFGKKIIFEEDFNKSISLNWWCDTPKEFYQSTYNHTTELYFVGKLFENLIEENSIENFAYLEELREMTAYDPINRIKSFKDILNIKRHAIDLESLFNNEDLEIYRNFSESLSNLYSKIESEAIYISDTDIIIKNLEECYRNNMLELYLQNNECIVKSFINGAYSYYTKKVFDVRLLYSFIKMFKNSNTEKRKIILLNINSKLDSISRYTRFDSFPSDAPF